MKTLRRVALLALALILAGCAALTHDLERAGAHPGYLECAGKIAISGQGTANLGAGIGGTGSNSWSIVGDCGEGFRFSQGQPSSTSSPTVTSSPSK